MAPSENQHRRQSDSWVKKAIEYTVLVGTVASLTYGAISLKFAKNEDVDSKDAVIAAKVIELEKHNIKIDAKLDYIIETITEFKNNGQCGIKKK